MDAWFLGNLNFLWKDEDDDDDFFKMDEAWPNALSLVINVNFEKSYCVGTSIKQNLGKTRSKSENWAKQGLLGWWTNGLCGSADWHI